MDGGLKYCSACDAMGRSVLLIYGALLLPLICDQLWFSIRMIHTVLMFPVCAAAGRQAPAITKNNATIMGIRTRFIESLSFLAGSRRAAPMREQHGVSVPKARDCV